MKIVQICVGSSCHLKGSAEIIELLKKGIEENHLEDEVTLTGNFCAGKCNRVGVTIKVDEEVYPGITQENFKEFFNDNILKTDNESADDKKAVEKNSSAESIESKMISK